ncbi:MAG: hypothetical protein FD138_2366 [Planctomycetota bacterium]|nr:MAG: hypothetical protein FD138_2366 [Planctomycetota bacterium]
MEDELHQRRPLDVAALDVMDAVDVEEVVLVVVGQQPFHLRRVHAAIRLADVNHRQIERREDVHRHPREWQLDAELPQRGIECFGPHGHERGQQNRNHRHHHGDRAAERKDDRIHAAALKAWFRV